MGDQRASTAMAEASRDNATARTQLQDIHDSCLALCAELENVADQLPSLPAPARVRRISNQLEKVMARFRQADTILSGTASEAGVSAVADTLVEIAGMHIMDALHGEDVLATLWDCTAREAVPQPGELGYMLRCFFDGCRRVVAIERLLFALLEQQVMQKA